MSAAQTGEEYRQTLRKELELNRERIAKMPWKAGSGMTKGSQRGIVFCIKVGDRTYLRFVKADEAWAPVLADDQISSELGACLRIAECEPQTQRRMPPDLVDGKIFTLWEAAKNSVWRAWMHETDPANLQPRLRPLNLRVAEYIRSQVPTDVDANRLRLALDILESPWPRREEVMLRDWFDDERRSGSEKSSFLIDEILRTGLEPFREPPTLPPIGLDEIELVCWMAIEPST